MLQEEWGKPQRRHLLQHHQMLSLHDEHDDGTAGVEDAAESDRQSAGSQPKKTKSALLKLVTYSFPFVWGRRALHHLVFIRVNDGLVDFFDQHR